ncbi:hypothetical protein LCGC14_3106590 [marine sediment metagenome]|uniref:Uncharacterized protein n=1 Tax=marine sediment metagenome TaxID=412755 RepID=A0A0F8W6E2_9ZZZZ
METKICPKCERELPVEAFNKCRSTKDGLQGSCRECYREYQQKNRARITQYQRGYRKRNQDRGQVAWEKYYNTIAGRLRQVFNDIKQRCDNPNCESFENYGGRGIKNKFGSLDEFRDYVTNELKVDPRGLQVDRIDNDGHYEKGNIRFVTAKVNMNNRRKKVVA